MSQPPPAPAPAPKPSAPRTENPPKPPPGQTPPSTQQLTHAEIKHHMRYIHIRPEARSAAHVPTLTVGTWTQLWMWMEENGDQMTAEMEKAVHEELVVHYGLLVKQGFSAWPEYAKDAVSGLFVGYRNRGPMFEERKGEGGEAGWWDVVGEDVFG